MHARFPLLRVGLGQPHQVPGAPRQEELTGHVGNAPCELSDHRVILLAIGLLQFGQFPDADDGWGQAFTHRPCRGQRVGREPRRPGHEIGPDPERTIFILQVRAPPAAEPALVERGAEAVGGAMAGEDQQHVRHRLRVLTQNPVAVLAHDRELVLDDGLTAADHRADPAVVELVREANVDVHSSSLAHATPTSGLNAHRCAPRSISLWPSYWPGGAVTTILVPRARPRASA